VRDRLLQSGCRFCGARPGAEPGEQGARSPSGAGNAVGTPCRRPIRATWGLGEALLADALGRTARAADNAGICALAVHVKDDRPVDWYRRYDFKPSPSDLY